MARDVPYARKKNPVIPENKKGEKMKISQILKYSGIVVGGIAAIFIVMALFNLILAHKIALVVMGLGALAYFVGVWFNKQGK